MPTRPVAVVFDVIETLFALDPLRERMAAAGVPGARLETWFARTLRDGMALDATGVYRPFKEVATAALLGLMAEEGAAPDQGKAEAVVAGFAELPAQPDAGAAMRRLREAGVRVAALTNGAAESTRGLLENAGLADMVERVISVAEVEHWKPRPEVYCHAADRLGVEPARLALIAAHAWDTHGAKRAGLLAAYVARAGEPFPAVMAPPDAVGGSLLEVADTLAAWPAG